MTHYSGLDCQVGCWTARGGRKAKPGQRFAWSRWWGWWLSFWRALGCQALCASRWLMTGLHCETIVHIIGDEQRTYLVVKGTGRNRELRLSRAMVDMGTLKYWCCATQNFCTHSQQRRVTLQEIILCTSLPRPRFQYANPLLFSRPLENGNKKQYSMSYYQLRVLLLFFTLIIVNNIAPPPPTRDFNNNTYDCNEESGRSAANYK